MKGDVVIAVRGVAKRFRIAHQEARPTTLAEAVARKLRHPFRQLVPEEFWALRDISFEVRRGDVMGIIGRNGAGKSTLLKILSRIMWPTAGEIELVGRVGSLLEVGTGFHPELTGRENIFLNGTILGMTRPEIRRRFDEIVAFAEIEHFLDTPVKRYSSGMYVRLAFAVAAHLDPEILIVDEVLAVGDGTFQKKCLGKMQSVAEGEGRTVLFVSHNMAAIRRLCRRAVFLDHGRATGCGTVDEAIGLYEGAEDVGATEVDLAAKPRSNFGGLVPFGEAARILRVAVVGGEELQYGRPLRLRFVVECRRRIEEGHVNVTFESMGGVLCLTLDSINVGQTFTWAPGVHEIELALDWNPLHPGRYYGNVAAAAGSQLLDHVAHAFVWNVRPADEDLFSEFGNGGCRPATAVRCTAVAREA